MTDQTPSTPPDSGKDSKPAYISYVQFKNFVDWAKESTIPERYDNSILNKRYTAGGVKSALVSALKFLGLLEGDSPTKALHDLVESTDEDRKTILLTLLKERYDKIDFARLERATPGMLEEWMKSYDIQGDTLRKAISFFLNAVKDTPQALSPQLKVLARNRPTKANVKPRGTGRKPLKVSSPPPAQAPQAPLTVGETLGGQSYQVALGSGGSLTLTLSANMFALSSGDFAFVKQLFDEIKKYEANLSQGKTNLITE